MSKLNDILEFVKAKQAAMTLQVDGNALTVVKRKLPKREENVDTPYMVTVSGAELVEEVKPAAFGGNFFVPYQVEITLCTPNDRDQLRCLADHADWFETTRGIYMVPGVMDSLGYIYRVDVVNGKELDRAQIKDGYDYTQVVVKVTTFETRTLLGAKRADPASKHGGLHPHSPQARSG